MKERVIISSVLVFGMIGCGDKRVAAPKGGDQASAIELDKAAEEGTDESYDLLQQDLSDWDDTTLETVVNSLSARDRSESRELIIKTRLNTELCKRLNTLKNDCSAAASLIVDPAVNSILNCGDNLDMNVSTPADVEVEFNAPGDDEYKLVGNDYYATDYFTASNATGLIFKAEPDAPQMYPRYMELSSFVLQAKDGTISSNADFSFKVRVNGTVFAGGNDFERIKKNTKTYSELKPSVVLGVQESADCKVGLGEIQELRNIIIAEIGQEQQAAE